MDGGTAYNVELPALVKHCRSKGFADGDIYLDVVLLSPTKDIVKWKSVGKTLKNYNRAKKLKNNRKTTNLLAGFMRANPLINFRYLIEPQDKLMLEVKLVDFNPSRSVKLIN